MLPLTDGLKTGDSGEDVKDLQEKLTALGFTVDVDGTFGPATDKAVREFQAANNIPPDGVFGEASSAAMHVPVVAVPPTMHHDGLNAIARLSQFRDRGRYVFGAGGTNPNQSTPFTWVGSQYGLDCIGAVCWALGIPRHSQTFPEYGGDIGVDSAMMDAGAVKGGAGRCAFFRQVEHNRLLPGHIVCFPSIRANELYDAATLSQWGTPPTARIRIGHIGFVVGWDGLPDPEHATDHPWDGKMSSLVTLECCADDPAVLMRRNRNFLDGTTFSHGGQTWQRPEWGVRFLEYVGG